MTDAVPQLPGQPLPEKTPGPEGRPGVAPTQSEQSRAAAPDPSNPAQTPGSSAMWVIAFLFFPFGTIIYMAVLRVVSLWLSAGLFLFSGVLCFFVDVSNPWMLFAVFVVLYAIGALQFHLGWRKRIWSPRALRTWRSLAYAGAFLTFLVPYAFYQLTVLKSLLESESYPW